MSSRHVFRLLMGAATMLAVTGVAVAAELSLDAARRCAAMTDSVARVACYDQLYATATAPAPAPAPAAVAAPAPVAPTVAVAAAIGDESLKKSSAQRAAEPATPTSVDANITALREMRPNVYRISLDSGQVWQQEESEALFTPGVGDTVRIKKGSLGRYSMSRLSNGKTTGWARVTRLE
jgi:hypothetical protein